MVPRLQISWPGGSEIQPGSQLYYRPDGTKTLRAADSGRVLVEALSSLDQHLCCIWCLQQLQLECTAFAGQQLSGTRPSPCHAAAAASQTSRCPLPSNINAMLQLHQQQFDVCGDIALMAFCVAVCSS